MKSSIVAIALIISLGFGFANHEAMYATSTGNIDFFSHTDLEDVQAKNHKVKSAFVTKGKIQFVVLIKDFEFEKALMQEHFNENYMESSEFPKSTFDGMIEDIDKIDFHTDGIYKSLVKGKLTLKDVTQEVSAMGTFTVNGETVNAKAKFIVNPDDYNVKIPKMMSNKISRKIEVSVDIDYKESH